MDNAGGPVPELLLNLVLVTILMSSLTCEERDEN